LNLYTYGGYIYVAENPGEIHITNSVFSNAAVLYSLFFLCLFLFFIYFYYFFFFNRRLAVELFT
jgi:hypothetical protein